ncbi:hypothetical protein EFA46_016045 (plasmid) [Halarchaeum sp. CBA1220]|uniref:hypothetical protein n=1 Tax=Halarchaeum sp. CBA1220 TaxID=1853682 RepID=UPI0015A41303|nr:hypothetical protein [Halarchaeum sp. CBA1220]QLC35769.1 hypothetical protein EFA46_016045 [Halarchaeum sp. CBA1220]
MKDQYRVYPEGWRQWPKEQRLAAIFVNNTRAELVDRIHEHYVGEGETSPKLRKEVLIRLYDDLYSEIEPDPPMIGKTEEENEELERALVELKAD